MKTIALIISINLTLFSFSINAKEPIDTREVVVPTVVATGTAGSIAAFTGSIAAAGFLVAGTLGVLVGDGIYRSGLGEKLGTNWLGKKIGGKLFDLIHSKGEESRNLTKESSIQASSDENSIITNVIMQ